MNKNIKEELRELADMSDIITEQYRKELDIEEGSATRGWLEKYNENHPLLKINKTMKKEITAEDYFQCVCHSDWRKEKGFRKDNHIVPIDCNKLSKEETRKRWEEQNQHNDYQNLGKEIGKLVEEKQKAYGDSFNKSGEVLKVLYPNGISPEQYTDALCVVRIVDKLFRIATDKDALQESPYRDIAGYGLLGAKKK